jgi:hypothetical protein
MIDIFLDDIRDPSFVGVDGMNWIVARTADECIALLEKHAGQVVTLSLDHDLADEHYYQDKASKEKTCYDVALWIEEQAAAGNLKVVPKWMLVHSMNPVGKAKILKCIESIKKIRDEQDTSWMEEIEKLND